MKGVATLQQHGYFLLMYNIGFLHHACTATLQHFRRQILPTETYKWQTTEEYWLIHWISGPWENSVAPSWMGMFAISKIHHWRRSFAHLPITSGEEI